jgi:hypothetical protein
MIQASFRTLLVETVGAMQLLEPGWAAASGAAIAMSVITVRTDSEDGLAAAANPLTENRYAMKHLAHPRAGIDKGNRIMAG